uniref:CD247 molecule n=1 Tax=Calidris pygmaea TaxID=425635 RepID=A0A8C3J3L3_9CHAR
TKWELSVKCLLFVLCSVGDAIPILGLTDPRLCYILDGFLFIYAVIMTALFVKEKVSLSKHWCIWLGCCKQKLSHGHRDEYDVLGAKRGADPELGGRHQSLQKDKMGEAYSEIGMKGEHSHWHLTCFSLFQGLSTATKDTYDALQMQPLPPR